MVESAPLNPTQIKNDLEQIVHNLSGTSLSKIGGRLFTDAKKLLGSYTKGSPAKLPNNGKYSNPTTFESNNPSSGSYGTQHHSSPQDGMPATYGSAPGGPHQSSGIAPSHLPSSYNPMPPQAPLQYSPEYSQGIPQNTPTSSGQFPNGPPHASSFPPGFQTPHELSQSGIAPPGPYSNGSPPLPSRPHDPYGQPPPTQNVPSVPFSDAAYHSNSFLSNPQSTYSTSQNTPPAGTFSNGPPHYRPSSSENGYRPAYESSQSGPYLNEQPPLPPRPRPQRPYGQPPPMPLPSVPLSGDTHLSGSYSNSPQPGTYRNEFPSSNSFPSESPPPYEWLPHPQNGPIAPFANTSYNSNSASNGQQPSYGTSPNGSQLPGTFPNGPPLSNAFPTNSKQSFGSPQYGQPAPYQNTTGQTSHVPPPVPPPGWIYPPENNAAYNSGQY